MPFTSKAQQRFMFAKHPEIAEEFAVATPDISKLPEHAPKMAAGGTTAGNPADLDPGIKDASVSDFLLPYMLAPQLSSTLKAGEDALDKLGEKGEVSLGGNAPKMEEAAGAMGESAPKVQPFIKGIQKSPNGNEIKIWGVRGDPDEIAKLGYGSDPGSVPEHILRQKGILPEQVDIPQNAPNAYADGGLIGKIKNDKDDAQKADDIDPIITAPPVASTDTMKTFEKGGPVLRSSLKHPVPNGMMARAMSDGGYPHVAFLENESPAEVKKDTHMEGHKAGPMDTTETGEKDNPPHMAEGGKTLHFLEGLKKGALHKEMGVPEGNKIPAKKLEHAANSDNETLRKRAQFAINAKKWHHADGGVIPHEEKMKEIYKAMGIKKYADGGSVDPSDATVSGSPLPMAPNPSDPTYWDQIKAALSQVGGAVGSTLEKTLPTMPAVAEGAANVAASPGVAPAINAALGTNLPGPEATAATAAPVPPPIAPPTVSLPKPAPQAAVPLASTPSMPNLSTIFNQDTSKLTEGVNPEDRQALANQLQGQQHGVGAIIAQAVSGLGDALAAKGGREQHSLQNIFSMEKTQRDEALANFDKARQDRIQKLQLQTQMGDNALKQAAAADAYGVDDNLNKLIGAPQGTMKKDLNTYFQLMSAQVAKQEKDADLYMKAHAQAGTDVDNAVKNASVLGIKPSAAQLQASGAKLADNYYNRAKGNLLIKSSDGQSLWIPATNLQKAKQLDPNLQVQP